MDNLQEEIERLKDVLQISADGCNYELDKKNQIIAGLNGEIFKRDREIRQLKEANQRLTELNQQLTTDVRLLRTLTISRVEN